MTEAVPGIRRMSISTKNRTNLQTSDYQMTASTNSSNNIIKAILNTPPERSISAPHEFMYTERASKADGSEQTITLHFPSKTSEVDGSEETMTLHYPFDNSNASLFDEVTASESLLLLSEMREGK